MTNKCAFCAELTDHFICCYACGEAICADHRTALPGPGAPLLGTGAVRSAPARYLCPNHRGGSPVRLA
jgi:hypothetical protein